jgi:hypothetical protein
MSRRCDRCGNRVRIRSFRCRHCGVKAAGLSDGVQPRSRLRRIGYGVSILFALGMLLVIGQRTLEPTVIADWYADLALQHLPQPFSSLAPVETSQGAFLFCIRRVVKDTLDPLSVATFPSRTDGNTVSLGGGRWQVATHVFEELENGERVRHNFRCVVQYQERRWVLEELSVLNLAQAQ